jgi:hypothetical protein
MIAAASGSASARISTAAATISPFSRSGTPTT